MFAQLGGRIALAAVLLTSLLAAVSGFFPFAPALHAAAKTSLSAKVTPPPKTTPKLHAPDLRDESAWFQLKHIGTRPPAVTARAQALAKASALPHARFGQPSQVSQPGGNTQTNAALSNGGLAPNGGAWSALGPAPEAYSTFCCQQISSGRITSVAVNPKNSNDIWIGAADGGVWNSTTSGAIWTPMTDTQQTLSVGAIAIDPNDPDVIYVGTGEANFNLDGYGGDGILKSTDHGQTWKSYGSSQFAGLTIGKIAIDPANSNTLFIAVSIDLSAAASKGTLPPGVDPKNAGIWLSTDGGQTWTQTLGESVGGPLASKLASATDVIFDPKNPNVVYAGFGQEVTPTTCPCLWESTSGGALGSWTTVASPVLPGSSSPFTVERVALSISQDGSYFYAVFVDNNGDLLNGDIYRSDHTAAIWTDLPVDNSAIVTDNDEHQWWYDTVIAADPTNSEIA